MNQYIKWTIATWNCNSGNIILLSANSIFNMFGITTTSGQLTFPAISGKWKGACIGVGPRVHCFIAWNNDFPYPDDVDDEWRKIRELPYYYFRPTIGICDAH